MKWELELAVRLGELPLAVSLAGDHRTVALVGPNGAGKSSVLKVIAGGVAPDRGRMMLGTRVLFDERTFLPPEARRVGYVPQGYGLFPHLTVRENVAFALGPRPAPEPVASWLERLGLTSLAGRRPARLSGGEQQRTALARALIAEPDILLLDEPLGALDVTTRRAVRSMLATTLADRRRPAVIVTHDARDVRALDAHVVVLEQGRVVQQGDLAALTEQPATPFVAEFCGV